MVILENIDIDIDKAILQNIDIDKISNRFKFGISNRAISRSVDERGWISPAKGTRKKKICFFPGQRGGGSRPIKIS